MRVRDLLQQHGRMKIVIYLTALSVMTSLLVTSIVLAIFPGETRVAVAYLNATLIPLIITPLISWYLVGLLIRVDQLEKEMRVLANFDSLTNLLNRRAFIPDAQRALDHGIQSQSPISVIALDIDKFKAINDGFGHAAGDQVLSHFANTARQVFRAGDLIARMGGEEFTIVMPNTDSDTANQLSENLHQAIRQNCPSFNQNILCYTISQGLVTLVPSQSYSLDALLVAADRVLYQAKAKGRNCTVVWNRHHN